MIFEIGKGKGVGNDAALRGIGIPAPLSQRYMRSATVHT